MFKTFMKKISNGKDEKGVSFEIDMDRIPTHIGIILDGNGRWAKKKGLPRSFGHKAGVEVVRKILIESKKLGVKYLTLYAFSTENWKRPKEEVGALMKLLVQYLKQEVNELDKNDVCLKFIGKIDELPKECVDGIYAAMKQTENNTGIYMNIAVNYGGRDEITKACREIALDLKEGKIQASDISEKLISDHLYTAGMPDPDMILRPSGEQRLSNFLLWQAAYSEFWVTNICWPDFSEDDLRTAIYDYQNRDRRFGGS